mmetsp:Transcript_8161/g.8179  ORF Transcript_8161/g.8179 Transcript_8161/m.8179 type:complete len:128 (-) Transcript_8161:387-770(-)
MAANSSSSGNRLNLFKDSKISDTTAGPEETTRLLLNSRRIANETEEIGERTMEEMIYQRGMLEDTGDHLASMKNISQSARKSIRQLQDRLFRKKLVLWGVIIVLFFANLGVIITLINNGGSLFSHRF